MTFEAQSVVLQEIQAYEEHIPDKHSGILRRVVYAREIFGVRVGASGVEWQPVLSQRRSDADLAFKQKIVNARKDITLVSQHGLPGPEML